MPAITEPSVFTGNGNSNIDSQKKIRESLKVLELTTAPAPYAGYVPRQCNSGASKLQHLLKNTNELIVCPGVYDGLSARVAINTGFSAMYMVCPSIRLSLAFSLITHAIDWSWNNRISSRSGRSRYCSTS